MWQGSLTLTAIHFSFSSLYFKLLYRFNYAFASEQSCNYSKNVHIKIEARYLQHILIFDANKMQIYFDVLLFKSIEVYLYNVFGVDYDFPSTGLSIVS